MSYYAPSKLILVFLVSLILSNSSTSVVSNQTTSIGVIIHEGSREGKEQKTAIEIAVRKLNSGSKPPKLAVHFMNSHGDPLEAASSANDLIDKEHVQVIVGMNTWEETTVVAKIGQLAKIPVISLTANTLQPLSHLQWPFLVQMTNLDMSYEINCIASVVQSCNWKRVIVVYEDNMYGGEYMAVSLLFEALQKIGSIIEHRVAIPHFTSPFDLKEAIRENLVDVLTTKQSRVFIVLKSSIQATTWVFEEANKLGLMGEDSAWILGESFSNFLDSLEPSVFQLMQGALGVKAHYLDKRAQYLDFKSKFKTGFRSNYPEEDKLEPGIYAIHAYDSIERISLALDQLEKLKDRNGEKFLEMILSTNFSSLTGKIHLQDETPSVSEVFQLVNVIGKSYKELGFWLPVSGFSKILKQLVIHWPGDLVNRIPKGWAMPSNAKKLKIGVPGATSFEKFVKVEQIEGSNETKYSGFCIEVFELVVAFLEKEYRYTLPYEFISHTGSNEDMVDKVYYKKYDAAVGDIAILANRSRYVKFTHPFIESEFSMVVPVKSDMQKVWKFMKPFTMEMWLATLCILLYTMFVVWFMEHQVNREFRGPWNHQLGTALWFTFSCLFFSHRNNIQSNHSKVVVMIWLFVVFIISSSYTASLTSILTVRSLEPTIRDIDWLRKTNASVGCDPNSFVCKYLKDALNLTNIKNVSREEKCRDHFTNGTISAAFLELSYQRYFFKEHCDEYMVVGPTLNNGGLGFVFPQDSPITDDVSRAILTLLEDGTIDKLAIEWLKADKSCLSSNPELEGERLGLTNFWGLFLISGLTSTLSLGVFIYRLNHNQIKRIVSFNGRWKKAARVVKIALNFKRNKVQPEVKMEPTNKWEEQSPPEDRMEPSNKWDDQRSPQRWERVSPTEVPEHVEIGRPTQLEIPMRKMDSGKY